MRLALTCVMEYIKGGKERKIAKQGAIMVNGVSIFDILNRSCERSEGRYNPRRLAPRDDHFSVSFTRSTARSPVFTDGVKSSVQGEP
jgi:hypothetical protein